MSRSRFSWPSVKSCFELFFGILLPTGIAVWYFLGQTSRFFPDWVISILIVALAVACLWFSRRTAKDQDKSIWKAVACWLTDGWKRPFRLYVAMILVVLLFAAVSYTFSWEAPSPQPPCLIQKLVEVHLKWATASMFGVAVEGARPKEQYEFWNIAASLSGVLLLGLYVSMLVQKFEEYLKLGGGGKS